jgi:hypothetical protein
VVVAQVPQVVVARVPQVVVAQMAQEEMAVQLKLKQIMKKLFRPSSGLKNLKKISIKDAAKRLGVKTTAIYTIKSLGKKATLMDYEMFLNEFDGIQLKKEEKEDVINDNQEEKVQRKLITAYEEVMKLQKEEIGRLILLNEKLKSDVMKQKQKENMERIKNT